MGTEIQIGGADAEQEQPTPRRPRRATATSVCIFRVVATYTRRKGSQQDRHGGVGLHVTIGRSRQQHTPRVSCGKLLRGRPQKEMPKGTAIGNRVTATDRDSVEILTYWLSGMADASRFDINPRTGQLEVKNELDFEGVAGGTDQCGAANQCLVIVTVADSSGVATTGTDPIDHRGHHGH